MFCCDKGKFSSKTLLFSLGLFLVIGVGFVIRTKINAGSCCSTPVFSDNFDLKEKIAVYNNRELTIPSDVFVDSIRNTRVLGSTNEEKWVEVDLSEQKLWAWEGTSLFLESLVSTGLPWYPTPQGEFRIWSKARATKMEGGQGRYYYYLPNVPFVMFFENGNVPGFRGYSLHGTYWHNDFGKVHSHGCINLPTPIAERLYYWTTPVLADGKFYTKSTVDNPGTRIVVHE